MRSKAKNVICYKIKFQHSQLEIFKRFKLDSPLSSSRRNTFRIRSRSSTSSLEDQGWQGSEISIHKLCKAMQTITV